MIDAQPRRAPRRVVHIAVVLAALALPAATLADGGLVRVSQVTGPFTVSVFTSPTPLRVGPDEAAYGDYVNWLFRSDATLTFPQTIVLRYTQLEPPERRLPQAAEDYTIWYFSRLRSVEAALEGGKDFLCANRFTMADIAVHFALYLGERLGLDKRYKPNTLRYLHALKQRPAFRRAMAKQDA